MTIEAGKKNWKIFGLPKVEVLKELKKMEKEGKTLIPAEDCDNFDEKTGCRGHQLAKGL